MVPVERGRGPHGPPWNLASETRLSPAAGCWGCVTGRSGRGRGPKAEGATRAPGQTLQDADTPRDGATCRRLTAAPVMGHHAQVSLAPTASRCSLRAPWELPSVPPSCQVVSLCSGVPFTDGDWAVPFPWRLARTWRSEEGQVMC